MQTYQQILDNITNHRRNLGGNNDINQPIRAI